ncbi:MULTISPECIES: hypothetical protein [Arthrobacter]|uniref:SHOCT domain-containing protein n=1 Tax=Arthrobacter psychrochitiniphilus TaxID=291045 RepID=A0A2V3DV18_9MICC|nr:MULTISPECIES: hypothetical protein [Arthrobacter]NYG16741.1 hypothetical protein [Arthrobacter psychrochitiniphilus]PXA69159.1 hypothetical protein CVS29_00875 [Arthrobacter psychrochitiniphilus]
MPVLFASVAAVSSAASSSSSFNIQPFFVLIIVGIALLSTFIKAAARKRNNKQNNNQYPNNQHTPNSAGRTGVAHPQMNAPYVGTLLNGVPMRNYDTAHGHQTTGFANERMKAEAELKRQLDALDAARRNGQVTAEQYAVHREAIFKNF